MENLKIPHRPYTKTKYELSEEDKDCIVWTIVFNRPHMEYWMKLICPNAKTQIKAKREEACEAWWSQPEVKKFAKDYQQTLKEIFNPPKIKKPVVVKDKAKETEKALNTFRDDVIDSLKTPTRDVEILKEKAQLAKTIGILKEEEEVQVAPIRYLPTRCDECRYKKFIEEQIELGNIIEDNN